MGDSKTTNVLFYTNVIGLPVTFSIFLHHCRCFAIKIVQGLYRRAPYVFWVRWLFYGHFVDGRYILG